MRVIFVDTMLTYSIIFPREMSEIAKIQTEMQES